MGMGFVINGEHLGDVEIIKGEDRTLYFNVTSDDGVNFSLAAATDSVTLSIFPENQHDVSALATYTGSFADGDSQVSFVLTYSNMTLSPGDYSYEMKWSRSGGDTKSEFSGKFKVK